MRSELSQKVEASIARLKTFCPDEGYYLAFSGGKDSVVIKALAQMAGVKYDAHYHVTSVDPPELVRFVLDQHKDVSFDIPHYDDGKPITMWNLIPKHSMPPTRVVRYCCDFLKERGGENRRIVTGVRWAESARRAANRGEVEIWNTKKKEMPDLPRNKNGIIILNNDNDDNRREIEHCFKKNRWIVNPIIEWDDRDVWDFIRGESIPYCGLYDDGMTRLGCIGCPLGGRKKMLKEFARYPKYKEAYLRAFGKMIEERKRRELPCALETPEEVFAWWVREPNAPEQISMEELMEGMTDA